MSWLSRLFPTIHADSDKSGSLTAALKSVRTAVAVPETELKRWRRIFDANAKVVNGEKCACLDALGPRRPTHY
jgi:solute carrier family 25 aspartate/glutamate transporter 12/13